MKRLSFEPLWGLRSNHLQTVLPSFLAPGAEPPSNRWIAELDGGDQLSCELSAPKNWQGQTVVLVHGLGGSHASNYMIRIARKLYLKGCQVIRVNLRGCGSGAGLSKLPYCGGNSADLLRVLQTCKSQFPNSPVTLIGFSLGGNIALKLAGELGEGAAQWIESCIAVCAPLHLGRSVRAIERYTLYHRHFLKSLIKQFYREERPRSLYEIDDTITAPFWGYRGAEDYYQNCSSIRFLPHIRQSTRLLYAEDDPFVDLSPLKALHLPDAVQAWTTQHGGHMGFLGRCNREHKSQWMDQTLLEWV